MTNLVEVHTDRGNIQVDRIFFAKILKVAALFSKVLGHRQGQPLNTPIGTMSRERYHTAKTITGGHDNLKAG